MSRALSGDGRVSSPSPVRNKGDWIVDIVMIAVLAGVTVGLIEAFLALASH